MAASSSHEYRQREHLPPSPPPSPPSARRRHKKKPDPFEQLATTPLPSAPSSPTNEPEEGQEPLWIRILVTPLLFTSFLLSLFLINYQNRVRRTEAHTSRLSILNYLAPSSWLDPEPYQDPNDSTWGHRVSAGHVEPNDAIAPKDGDGLAGGNGAPKKRKRKSWHLNRKVRKMAKLEVGDALEMRGRIMVGMIALMGVGSVLLWMGLKWLVKSMSNLVSGARS